METAKKQNKIIAFFKNVLMGIKQDWTMENQEFMSVLKECLILSVFLFASLIYKYFVFAVLGVALYFIVKHRNIMSFYIMVFLLPFLNIIRLKPTDLYYSIFLWCVVLLILAIKLLKDFIDKKKKINWFFTAMCLALAVYFILPFGPFSFSNHGAIYLSLAILFVLYYYSDSIKFKELVAVFGMGVIFASFFGLFRPLFSRAQEMIPFFINVGNRFSGVSNDPNYYAGDVLLLLACSLSLFMRKQINYSIYPITLLCTIFCVKTVGKMMFVLYALLMIIACVYWLIKNKNKKAFYQVLALFVVCLMSLAICFNQVKGLLVRFSGNDLETYTEQEVLDREGGNYEDEYIYVFENNIFTKLTTGRTNIWKAYWAETTKSASSLLFGNGIGAEFVLCSNGYSVSRYAEHNAFVQMIYRLGLFGSALVIVTIISTIKKENFKKFNFTNLFVAFIIFGLYMSLCNLLSYRFSIYITILAKSLTCKKDESEEIEQIELKGREEN